MWSDLHILGVGQQEWKRKGSLAKWPLGHADKRWQRLGLGCKVKTAGTDLDPYSWAPLSFLSQNNACHASQPCA